MNLPPSASSPPLPARFLLSQRSELAGFFHGGGTRKAAAMAAAVASARSAVVVRGGDSARGRFSAAPTRALPLARVVLVDEEALLLSTGAHWATTFAFFGITNAPAGEFALEVLHSFFDEGNSCDGDEHNEEDDGGNDSEFLFVFFFFFFFITAGTMLAGPLIFSSSPGGANSEIIAFQQRHRSVKSRFRVMHANEFSLAPSRSSSICTASCVAASNWLHQLNHPGREKHIINDANRDARDLCVKARAYSTYLNEGEGRSLEKSSCHARNG